MLTSYLLYIPIAAATLLVIHYLFQKRPRQLPPGPKGRFLIGNLHDLPRTEAERAKTYVEWRRDYGDIMHLDVIGGHMIVLNTLQATRDVMEKRAATYSGRPRMVMFTELAGADWFFSVMSGEPHKERRAVAQRYFLAQIKDWQHAQQKAPEACFAAYTRIQTTGLNFFACKSDLEHSHQAAVIRDAAAVMYGVAGDSISVDTFEGRCA